jgi:hypothetical protein
MITQVMMAKGEQTCLEGDERHIASAVPGHRNVTVADRRCIVFRSSVVEHAAGPKAEVADIRSSKAISRKRPTSTFR